MPDSETLENEYPEPSGRNYLLSADGSGTGTVANPSPGAIGVVLKDPDGNSVGEISKAIGPATNTVAEYRALIEGLELAHLHGIKRIRVFLDSELVTGPSRRSTVYESRSTWFSAFQAPAYAMGECHARLLRGRYVLHSCFQSPISTWASSRVSNCSQDSSSSRSRDPNDST